MAALTAARDTKRSGFDALQPALSFPVLASAKIFPGAIVALSAAGYAKPAAVGDTKVVGVAEALADNTGGANGAIEVRVRRGTFKFANKGGDLVTQAHVATPALCYIDDDNTVRATAAGTIAAGRPLRVESDGVWVEIY